MEGLHKIIIVMFVYIVLSEQGRFLDPDAVVEDEDEELAEQNEAAKKEELERLVRYLISALL